MICLHWPDRTRTCGTDATQVLDRLGARQWSPCDGASMKRRLSDRAWSWDGSLIDPELDDAAFLAALAESTMVRVTWTEEETTS